jgi:hypothetical protein
MSLTPEQAALTASCSETRLSSQSAYIQSLLGIVQRFTLESIGRAPAQPVRVGLTSSPSFRVSLVTQLISNFD